MDQAAIVQLIYEALEEQGRHQDAANALEPAFSKGGQWQRWAKGLGAYLGRYVKEGKEAEYNTVTKQGSRIQGSEVWKASDVLKTKQKVLHAAHYLCLMGAE